MWLLMELVVQTQYTHPLQLYTMSIFEFCVVYILHYFQNKTKQNIIGLILYYE